MKHAAWFAVGASHCGSPPISRPRAKSGYESGGPCTVDPPPAAERNNRDL
ncbi:hypothetical protein FTUN_7066 [Frigoriglobus tundricola]|uniref:Uncharacterized protein n=1 Tax=Frigoriglobus tundricola TaxID=2774151 RepID=A0A6M5Z0X5_9BACT|nr:hypothetical protein FTUN_7066 [Frigoriglobus tundricola]